MKIDLEGTQISKYRLGRLLGRGGMGSVYQAQDETLNRLVAIKIIHPSLMVQPQFHSRFLQEAQTTASLDHPSIIKIYDFDSQDKWLYMVMELVTKGNLATYLKEWQEKGQEMPLGEIVHLIAQVADALSYADQRGVIHRDIKPDNVLLKALHQPERSGEPALRAIVTDFGLAKLKEGSLLQTEPSLLLGTLPYISPEQLEGKKPDGRTDLYALGIVLYEMVTGQLPYDIRTPDEAFRQHRHGQPQPPHLIRSDVPPAVAAIIAKAMAKDPRDRYRNGTEMAAALYQAARQLPDDQSSLTQMAPLSPDPKLVTPPPVPEPARAPAQLFVTRDGDSVRNQPLHQDSLTIGRTTANDIVLSEDSVSGRHARLQRSGTGWQVVDLQSTNGTFLGSIELTPHVPYPWPTGEKLTVGPFTLTWQTAVAKSEVSPGNRPVVIQAPAPAPAPEELVSPAEAELTHLSSIRLEPMSVSIRPGMQATVQAQMYNESTRVDHFAVAITGLPTNWVQFSESSVKLMPEKETTFRFLIQPPAQSALAQIYPYRLVLRSMSDQRIEGQAFGQVQVEPLAHYAVTLNPPRVKNAGNCQVVIQNSGNKVETFTITAHEGDEAIVFDQMVQRVTVEPGQEDRVNFYLKPLQRPLTGTGKKSHPFQFRVAASTGEPKSQAGQLELSPWLPRWIISFLMVLLFGSASLSAALLSCSRMDQQAFVVATATAVEQATADAINAQGTVDAAATATQIVNETATATAAVATSEAATVTADAFEREEMTRLAPTVTPTPELPPAPELLPGAFFDGEFRPVGGHDNLRIPVGWLMEWSDNVPNRMDPGTGPFFFRPESGPISREQLPEHEQDELILKGNQSMKIFKDSAPIYFAMYRTTELEAGAYRFTVRFFADVVEGYAGDEKVYATHPLAAEVQLCAAGVQYDFQDWQPAPAGAWGIAYIDFVVPRFNQVFIYASFRNRFELPNNGWFFDYWSLTKIAEYEDSPKDLRSNIECERPPQG